MNISARLTLLFLAAIAGGYVALFGVSVSRALDPERFNWVSLAFWTGIGLLISAPMWAPALLPNRFPRFLRISRFFAALFLLVPTWFFSRTVTANVNRVIAGAHDSVMPFVQASVLTVVCLVGVVILVWPELRSMIKRAT
jgi:hypothetical protein